MHQIGGLYKQLNENVEQVRLKKWQILNKEMAILRLKVGFYGDWKSKGLFKENNNKNKAIEEEYWRMVNLVEMGYNIYNSVD